MVFGSTKTVCELYSVEALETLLETLYRRLSISVFLKERKSASLGGLKSQIRELVKVEIAFQLAAYWRCRGCTSREY